MKNLLFSFIVIFAASVGGLGMTACASFPTAAQITSTAESFVSNAEGYVQTLGTMIQTATSLAGIAAPQIEALAQQWGLLPANSSQAATFTKVVNAIENVNTTAAGVEKLVATIQATGTIPSTANTSGKYHYHGIYCDIAPWRSTAVIN
jgi:hypothetical protein